MTRFPIGDEEDIKPLKTGSLTKTPVYLCKSWYDGESDTVRDCTCGTCEKSIKKEDTKPLKRMYRKTILKERKKRIKMVIGYVLAFILGISITYLLFSK